MSDLYEEKGYGGQEVGFGNNLGILVVDFQLGFTDPKFQMGGGEAIDAAVEQTARVVKIAREKGIPVANCYVAYPDAKFAPYWKIPAVPRDLRRDSDASDLDERIVDHDYDYVFEKIGASAFFQSPLTTFLVKNRVDTLAVTGCVTSGCVRASVVDSFQFGFRTMIVDDCCGDNAPQPHLDTLRDVGRRYADVITADELINHMMANNAGESDA